jgi:hypothetical protein
MTVWIYVDSRKEVGDKDHLKVFANLDAANRWFEENDPEGVAFEDEVLSKPTDAPWNAVSAYANCGRAVAHVRGSSVAGADWIFQRHRTAFEGSV